MWKSQLEIIKCTKCDSGNTSKYEKKNLTLYTLSSPGG